MADRITELVVLAEDRRAADLLRKYSAHLRIHRRRIRVIPFGAGAGDQHVLAHYSGEVREQRRCAAGGLKSAALLVHVDADSRSVEARHHDLADRLKSASMPPRGAHERIAVIVPKRHTETWLHGLTGVPVDESQDCKRDRTLAKEHDERLAPGALRLYELTRPNAVPPPTNLPSVGSAVSELRRLE